jgi:hypothetical protein
MWFDQGSKYRSKSDCEAKRKRNFFREKLRSEAKRKYFSFVRSEAERTIFQNCEKLRKIGIAGGAVHNLKLLTPFTIL